LKVLFLSADTGGGHRASAEALAKQFQIHFPGSTYNLLDVWDKGGVWPYGNFNATYKHLSSHPNQWRILYYVTNSAPAEFVADSYAIVMCEKKIRKCMESYDPDLIVSVHPAMNAAPRIASKNISESTGKHIPFFTVCTDLGSGHSMWFQKDVEKLYLASDQLFRVARSRGQTPEDKIVKSGLPIRQEFAVQAEKLGDRSSASGIEYQNSVRTELGISTTDAVVLLMGGGEGVGSLNLITEKIFTALTRNGLNATICVVCGRNETLKTQLNGCDWEAVLKREKAPLKSSGLLFGFGKKKKVSVEPFELTEKKGVVKVMALGFTTQIAEYMVAADVLVSKAGPGTIAEAASLSLPVMLTSFLPGQEAGNVDFVLEHGFGDYAEDPSIIGDKVAKWLRFPNLMQKMVVNAREIGRPNAAAEIVLDIGLIAEKWMSLNEAQSSFEEMKSMARCGSGEMQCHG